MKTVLVTGGNRGLGLEICNQFEKLGWQVILCSRNLQKGEKSANTLGKNITVKQLDVTSKSSIENLYQEIKNQIDKLDLLINNAALGESAHENPVKFKTKQTLKKHFPPVYRLISKAKPNLKNLNLYIENTNVSNISIKKVKYIMETNLFGAWQMIQAFIPLLEKSNNGQIINISSGIGTFKELSSLYPGYSISKASLNALTVMFSEELKNKNIKVNAVCPGWVKTDMGGPNAPKTIEEGVDTIIWLAHQKDAPTGKFFKNRKRIDW